MTLTVLVSPPSLAPFLNDEERRKRVVLADLGFEKIADDNIQIEIDIVFSPKTVRRGVIRKADYYVGSTGAEISIKPQNFGIIEYSKGSEIEVIYEETNGTSGEEGFSLTPNLKAKYGDVEGAVSLGSFEAKSTAQRKSTAKFSGKERQLETEYANPNLKWIVQLPRAKQIVRDYLQGNLKLFADFSVTKMECVGALELRPSDISFFGPDRQQLGEISSLRMKYVLWKKGHKIHEQAPETLNFRVGISE